MLKASDCIQLPPRPAGKVRPLISTLEPMRDENENLILSIRTVSQAATSPEDNPPPEVDCPVCGDHGTVSARDERNAWWGFACYCPKGATLPNIPRISKSVFEAMFRELTKPEATHDEF